MASGYGLTGGTSRCFPFWQELLACYVVNTTADDISGGKKCLEPMENYYECLHHTKEKKRAGAMQVAYHKRLAKGQYEAPDPEAIRNLGIIGKEADSRKVLALNDKQ